MTEQYISEKEEFIKELEKLQERLEKKATDIVEQKTTKMQDDIKATTKALDILQVRIKNPIGLGRSYASAGYAPETFDDMIRKSILENTDNFNKLNRKEIKSFGFELKAAGDMTIGGNYTGGNVGISSSPIGIVGGTTRLRHVRDVLRSTTMSGSALPVLQDNGGEGEADTVAEGALKPTLDFDLKEASAKAQVIAGIVVFSKQFLDDVPSAQSWLTQKLIEVYMKAEDNQLLNGSGVSPDLSGMNTAGNFTTATITSGDAYITRLIKGIVQLRSLERNPTGIIINPTDYGNILLNKATGSGEFDLPSYVTVSPVGQVYVLGVPVIDTTAQTVGTYDIVDNEGSLLAFRQHTAIEFFEQDGTNVQYNKITARIESRIAFPIYGNSYIIKGSFSD